jgi:hypothetical protein
MRRKLRAERTLCVKTPVVFASLAAALSAYVASPSALPPQDPPAATRPAEDADVAEIRALETALYDVISGDAGVRRDWTRFQALFHPGARMTAFRKKPDGTVDAVDMTVEDYMKRAGPVLEVRGFHERGIRTRVDRFGAVAHLFSTYESRHKATDAAPFARGVNSIRLTKRGGKWRVESIVWDEERPDQPIPAEYLPAK